MRRCGGQNRGATGTASLPRILLEGRNKSVTLKIWCTDKRLTAHCLDPWGLFPQHPGGAPHLLRVYILSLVEEVKDTPGGHARPGALQEAGVSGYGGNTFLA